MSTHTDEAEAGVEASPVEETLLHRAIARVIEEFRGTAEGQPPRHVITFAVPGFSETELETAGRETFDRISAGVASELESLLERQLSEDELVVAVTETTEAFRVRSFGEEKDAARVYDALADTVDATVYYNRRFRPLPARG